MQTAPRTGTGAKPVPVLRLTGVTKRFGDLVANDEVDLELRAGEIHAILGENGAGKTTLMHLAFGSLTPDAGAMAIDGKIVPWPTTREAIERGIGMVHQHFMLIPTLTVAENVLLNVMATKNGHRLSVRDVAGRVREIGDEYGLALDPDTAIDDLSVGEKLRLEIVKVLLQSRLRGGLRAFVLDEPTALLTRQEIVRLFDILRGLADAGTAVAIITHKLEEVMELCHRVTVMRDGRVVRSMPTAETTTNELASLMVGREVRAQRRRRVVSEGEVVLALDEVSVADGHSDVLSAVTFEVRAGEIVGVAGVAGNGQDVLVECVTGLRRPTSGTIELEGRDITTFSRRELIERSVAHVPEDRRADGLVGPASLRHNFVLGLHRWPDFQRHSWLRRRRIAEHSHRLKHGFDVRATSIEQPVDRLSGGNQQRVIIGRELHKRPRLIVAAGPTRGIDIAGCEYIEHCLLEQRDAGAAILLVSLDLDELMAVSDRLVVMQGGRIRGELSTDETDAETLGLMMGGSSRGATEATS
ncbi:MAG: ABC transporter ATP-binding protein [Solirubrobacteraceae bacterium]|nr:ABC transporter ATP-binding protein [Solirubrobacteraceae bacterium]